MIDVTGGISFSITGVEAVGATGTEAITEGTGVTITSTGVASPSYIGSVSVDDMNIGVTGLEINTAINLGTVWQPIIPDQSPNWVEIGNRNEAA